MKRIKRKGILVIGRGYLAKKLYKDLPKERIVEKWLYLRPKYKDFVLNNFDTIIFANFPSTQMPLLTLYKKYKNILQAIETFKDKDIKLIFLNSYRIFYPTKNNLFDYFYIYLNKKLYQKTRSYVNHFFLPFIYDKDLICKTNSLFYNWFKGSKLTNETLELPTLSYKDFLEIFKEKINESSQYIFPSNIKSLNKLYLEFSEMRPSFLKGLKCD